MNEIIKPSRFRKQHGPVVRVDEQIQDVEGRPGAPFRAVDTLETLERNRTIGPKERAAGVTFRDDFARAAFPDLRAASMERVGTASPGSITVGQIDARERVFEALKVLGGMSSPGGLCAWYVLGVGLSLRDWALREGWGGRPLHQNTARGILLGVLGTLRHHYGY